MMLVAGILTMWVLMAIVAAGAVWATSWHRERTLRSER